MPESVDGKQEVECGGGMPLGALTKFRISSAQGTNVYFHALSLEMC